MIDHCDDKTVHRSANISCRRLKVSSVGITPCLRFLSGVLNYTRLSVVARTLASSSLLNFQLQLLAEEWIAANYRPCFCQRQHKFFSDTNQRSGKRCLKPFSSDKIER